MKAWEEMIAINCFSNKVFNSLPPANVLRDNQARMADWTIQLGDLLESALDKDNYPLPHTQDRENYYGNNHFDYWASGLRDYKNLIECCERHGLQPSYYLDFGCASGRVVRHFAINSHEITVYGCDINRFHVEWILQHLPPEIIVFQNHSLPILPLPDSSLDLISAFSVFTHIEAFETTWLMELRRILKPGGLAYITIHSDCTWEEMDETWPLYKGLRNHPDFDATTKPRTTMKSDRLIFRWKADSSYTSNIFYRLDYIKKVWSHFFEVVEILRRFPNYQDVVILKKKQI